MAVRHFYNSVFFFYPSWLASTLLHHFQIIIDMQICAPYSAALVESIDLVYEEDIGCLLYSDRAIEAHP